MTAIMVPATGASSGGGAALAKNHRGRQLVNGGDTVTLVSFVSGTAMLRGFHVYGDTDGFVWIEVDGVPLDGVAARHSAVKDAYRVLPNPEPYVSSSSIVALRVTNLSSGAAEFEGVILGE